LPQQTHDAGCAGAGVGGLASKPGVGASSASAVTAPANLTAPALAAGSADAATSGTEELRGAVTGDAAAGLGGFATPTKAARAAGNEATGAAAGRASTRAGAAAPAGGADATTPLAAAGAAVTGAAASLTTPPAAAAASAHASPSAVTPASHATASKRQPRSQARATAPRLRFTPDGKQVPIGNGGVGPADAYWWTQSLHDVSLHVVLPPGVRSKRQLGVRVGRDSVEVIVTGVAGPAAAPAARIRAAADTAGTDAGPSSNAAATAAGSNDANAAATCSGSGAPTSAAGGASVVMLAGQLYGPVRVDTESCGPAGVFWTWDSDPRAAHGRPRLPREADAGTGGDKGGAGRAAAEEDAEAGCAGQGEGEVEGEACSGVLTIPLEKAEDVWWRRILADPEAAAVPPHVMGLSGAGVGAGGAAGAETSSASARGVGTPARPAPGTRRAPGTATGAAGAASPAIPGLGAAPSPYDIDASLVDSTRPVDDYDADTQSAIRRIMYEQVSWVFA
jgi:hypothetical protein